MLRDGCPNPLTVHGLREVDSCPPHFIKIQFELRSSRKHIYDWIWENLEGRFWFGDIHYVTDDKNLSMESCAAFENPGEASMFALCLTDINNYNYY